MAYSDKVIDHYENPRNVGAFDAGDGEVGTGMVGAPACGDVMKLQIRVNPATGVIEDAKFKTYGCGSAIASSSLVTEWVKGKTLDQALAIKNTAIAEELALPPVKIHCSILAEDAIKAAVADYRSRHDAAACSSNAACAPDAKRRLTPSTATQENRHVRLPIPSPRRSSCASADPLPQPPPMPPLPDGASAAEHQRRRGRQGRRDARRRRRPGAEAAHLRHRRRLLGLPVRLRLRRREPRTTTCASSAAPITVVVDAMSLQYLMGAEIDYEDKPRRRALRDPQPQRRQHLRLRQFVLGLKEHAMTVTVTPKAADQIRKALAKRGGGVGLRLAVKTSGCSGYAYALEFVDAPTADDLSFESEGVQLLVDAAQPADDRRHRSSTGCAKA